MNDWTGSLRRGRQSADQEDQACPIRSSYFKHQTLGTVLYVFSLIWELLNNEAFKLWPG